MNQTSVSAELSIQVIPPASFATILLVEKEDVVRDSRRLVLSRVHPVVQVVEDAAGVFNLAPDARFWLIVIDMSDARAAERIAFYARRRWPQAKILLMGPNCAQMDDALYDDRVEPAGNPAALLEAGRRLFKSATADIFQSA